MSAYDPKRTCAVQDCRRETLARVVFDLTQKFLSSPDLTFPAACQAKAQKIAKKSATWVDGEKTTPVKSRADGSDSWKI
jgi:hypothetical protein